MDPVKISKAFKIIYFRQLIPAVILVGILYPLKYYFKLFQTMYVAGNSISNIIIIVAVVIGLALPIFYRSYFVYKVRDQKQINTEAFIRFEKKLLILSLVTPYFLALSLALNLKETANLVITMLALYTAYYYYPSEKKMAFEMKIFRIKTSQKEE